MPQIEKEVTIKCSQGLHARPAAMFVQTASKFTSSVTITKGDEQINGKSIMDILTLGAQKDTVILLKVDGDDAEEAFKVLEELLGRDE